MTEDEVDREFLDPIYPEQRMMLSNQAIIMTTLAMVIEQIKPMVNTRTYTAQQHILEGASRLAQEVCDRNDLQEEVILGVTNNVTRERVVECLKGFQATDDVMLTLRDYCENIHPDMIREARSEVRKLRLHS